MIEQSHNKNASSFSHRKQSMPASAIKTMSNALSLGDEDG